MNSLRILGSVLLPAAFGWAYAPLHKGWVVQFFGCACQRGFNANTFSFLLHSGVAVRAGIWLVRAALRLPLRPRMNAVSLGLIVISAVSFYFWQEGRVL